MQKTEKETKKGSSRIIKFRAWDKKRKVWLDMEVYAINPCGEYGLLCCGDQDFIVADSIEPELMQYTGLKDKNGVEIFENDVCIHKQVAGGLLEPAPAKNVQIVWTELHNGWICDDGKYQYSMQTSQLEIIGNIHENPELIKEYEAL